jgi:hypothetical protein
LQHGLDNNNFYEKVNKNFINTSNLPMGYCLEDQEAYLNLFKKCELENRRVLCNKSSFEQSVYLDLSIFDLKLIVKFIEYLVMVILNPILSIMGIISNVMVMIVVNKVKKKKDKFNDMKKSKDGMFNHIFIHSLFNVGDPQGHIYHTSLSYKHHQRDFEVSTEVLQSNTSHGKLFQEAHTFCRTYIHKDGLVLCIPWLYGSSFLLF